MSGNILTELRYHLVDIPLERALDETESLVRFIQEELIRSKTASGEGEGEWDTMESQEETMTSVEDLELPDESYIEVQAEGQQKKFENWMLIRSKLDGAVVELTFDKALPEEAVRRLEAIKEEVRRNWRSS